MLTHPLQEIWRGWREEEMGLLREEYGWGEPATFGRREAIWR